MNEGEGERREAVNGRGLEGEVDLERRLCELIASRCGLPAAEQLAEDRELMGLGLDSVGLVELLLDCEALAGRKLPRELFSGTPTVGEVFRHLAGLPEP